ncbi:MAG: DUF177 domain-containing protein [Pseudomonadota bacterium]
MTDNTIALSKLSAAGPYTRHWEPDAATRAAMAARLDLTDLRKLRADITLTPLAGRDWRLEVAWGATVVQPCVVTLAPVVTRLEDVSTLTYTARMPEVTEAEAEMPEDESLEPLPASIDLLGTVGEMIALALPDYPRADDTDMEPAIFGPPGEAPMTDEDAKPFAGLAALKEKLEKGGS